MKELEVQENLEKSNDFRFPCFPEKPEDRFLSLGNHLRDLSSSFSIAKRTPSPDPESDLATAIRLLYLKLPDASIDAEVDPDRIDHFRQKVDDLTFSFKRSMEDCFFKLESLFLSTEKALSTVRSLLTQIHSLSTATACGNLLFWLSNICCSTLVQRYIGHPKSTFVASTLIGTAAICGTVLSHSYFKQSIADAFRTASDIRSELESLVLEGLSMDRAMQQLFPQGYDKELLRKLLELRTSFESEESRRQTVSYLLITSKAQQDKQWQGDAEFLTSVKIFADSAASQAWWIRMKIQSLIENLPLQSTDLYERMRSLEDDFRRKTSIYALPIAGSLLPSNRSNDQIRFLVSCFGTLLAGMELNDATNYSFNPLLELHRDLEKEFATLKEIRRILNTEFD